MRRLLILATLVLGVVAAGAVGADAGPVASRAHATVAPTVIRITVKQGRPVGGIKRPSVRKGTVVRFVVVADRGESIHLHGYNLERHLRPGQRAVLHFTARIPGRFELELHHPDALLAQLTVRAS